MHQHLIPALVYAAALGLGTDHEKVVPNGMRLMGILFVLLPRQAGVESQDSAVVQLDAWVAKALKAIVEGVQSRSMKVGTHMLAACTHFVIKQLRLAIANLVDRHVASSELQA